VPFCLSECEDLRLLIGLMHQVTGYTSSRGHDLSLAQRVRLLALGGKLQVEACVAQCVDKVERVLRNKDAEAAMVVLESVPSEMEGREDVAALRKTAFDQLLSAMDPPRRAPKQMGRAWGVVVNFIEEKAGSMLEAWVWGVLESMLRSESVGDEVKEQVGTAVARYLGPVHRLWAPRPAMTCCWSEGLSAKVKVSLLTSAIKLSQRFLR
jgi:hypothetical protein